MSYAVLLDMIIPILSILISLFIGIYTVNRRVENENKESHKPYLVISKIEPLSRFDVSNYFITIFGRNYLKEYHGLDLKKILESDIERDFFVDLNLTNIGYGVASDIRFYNLLTGEEIIGTQQNLKNRNQKLFTTFDIATTQTKNLAVKIYALIEEDDNGITKEDHNRILCVYKDLNNHVYDAIIAINMKSRKNFDYFVYQRTSRSYKKWIEENKKEYKHIIKEYTSEK